jgi:hypothetical protein
MYDHVCIIRRMMIAVTHSVNFSAMREATNRRQIQIRHMHEFVDIGFMGLWVLAAAFDLV